MPINGPELEVLSVVNVRRPGGGETIYLKPSEVPLFKADPDAFAAKHYGLTVAQYAEWVATEGAPLCGDRTAKGTLCKNLTGGFQLSASEWKALHRELSCHSHAK